MARPKGKNREEGASTASFAFHADLAALRFHQALGQSQTKPRALVALGSAGVQLLELEEQSPQVLARDARTGIGNFQTEESRTFALQTDGNTSSGLCELEGVR